MKKKLVALLYDITNRNSFNKVEDWYKLTKENLGKEIVLGMSGNKRDLYMQEQVTKEESEEYAKSIGAKWSLTSAKNEKKQFIDYIYELIHIYIKETNIISENFKKKKNIQAPTIKLEKKS